jgi:hypothetical protein
VFLINDDARRAPTKKIARGFFPARDLKDAVGIPTTSAPSF